MGVDVRVSIVISNYNYGRFVGEAIASALGQTHHHVEVIVVDDGSTDDSLDVIRRFPVRVFARGNQGVCAARNYGAAKSTGDYLIFLDADDVLESGYAESCLKALVSAPDDVAYAYSGMQTFGLEARDFPSRPFDARRLVKKNFVNVSAMIRRSIFLDAGGFDPSWGKGLEDWEFWVRLLSRGYCGVWVPATKLRYRKHGPSRNLLERRTLRALGWKLQVRYPRLCWRKLVRYPLNWLYWRWRHRGPTLLPPNSSRVHCDGFPWE